MCSCNRYKMFPWKGSLQGSASREVLFLSVHALLHDLRMREIGYHAKAYYLVMVCTLVVSQVGG